MTGMELLAVPVILAIVEGIKQTTGLGGRWSFALSMGVAAVMAVGVGLMSAFTPALAVSAVLAGLSASGLYSGGKAVIEDGSES